MDQPFTDLTSVKPTTDANALAKLKDMYASEAARYQRDQKELEPEARNLELEVAVQEKKADRFDLAVMFLEVGLVISSITLLSGRRVFWWLGILLGIIGIAVASTGFPVQ